jgi:hypothetical protein
MDMTPQKLADWLQDKSIYLWDAGDEQYYASPICEDIVPMLRQQQAEIDEWKYVAQRLESVIKNKEAEIEVLKAVLTEDQLYELQRKTMMTWDDVLRKAQEK